jgi:hypothetical protein
MTYSDYQKKLQTEIQNNIKTIKNNENAIAFKNLSKQQQQSSQ